MDMTAQLEQIRKEHEANNARLADQVIEVLDSHGLGELVRSRLQGPPLGSIRVEPAAPAAKAPTAKPKRYYKPMPPPRTSNGVKVCTIPGCGKKANGRLCSMHYWRQKQGLDMNGPSRRGVPRKKASGAKAAPEESDKEDHGTSVPANGTVARGLEPVNRELAAGQLSGRIGNPTQFVGKEPPDRKTGCAAYNNCLGYAHDRKWPNWSCAGCTGPGVQKRGSSAVARHTRTV